MLRITPSVLKFVLRHSLVFAPSSFNSRLEQFILVPKLTWHVQKEVPVLMMPYISTEGI